ncbi:hypothetical protein SLS57_002858 [Botryosphaeria dothidea]
MSSTRPASSTHRPDQDQRHDPPSSSPHRRNASSSEAFGNAQEIPRESEAIPEPESSGNDRARFDRFTRVLAQMGYMRLKQLMREAGEELIAAQMDENDDENGDENGDEDDNIGSDERVRNGEVLARVVEMLKEAERISDVLSRELLVGPATIPEQEALAARLEVLEIEQQVGDSQRRH